MMTEPARQLVAGIDSSTQSCKVVICDAATGEVIRSGSAKHPDGTECDPQYWWQAMRQAILAAGGLEDVAAVSIGGQQHGMVCLDGGGEVIRPALLWNDTRSADAARDLTEELGAQAWADAVGLVPVASFTVSKLRWLADHEPDNAARVAAVALPHDWLTWQLRGAPGLEALVTDRSDASGTGYYDPVSDTYRRDLLARALRRDESDIASIVLPRVLAPNEAAGQGAAQLGLDHLILGPGCGDNAGAALGMGVQEGQTWVSLGTSGVVAAVSRTPTHDPTGTIAGFADATGHYLPLLCTLNATRVVDAMARVLGVDHAGMADLALAAEPGAGGLTHIPFLEGERTPNLPHATGSLSGMTLASMTRENLARAAVEGMLNLMAAALNTLREAGVDVDSVLLIGGGAKSPATRAIAPSILGTSVAVPPDGEYVARGAARQAAWALHGGNTPPAWPLGAVDHHTGTDQPDVRRRYIDAVKVLTANLS